MQVYSVFILSGSIGITAKPPSDLLTCSDESFGGVWFCTSIKYAYLSAGSPGFAFLCMHWVQMVKLLSLAIRHLGREREWY